MPLANLTIPDMLTCVRGLLAVVASFVVLIAPPGLFEILLMLFLVAACTDYADGFLARAWNQTSDFGKVFDPLFDKVIVFVYLIILYETGTIPTIVILLMITRDLIIDALRSHYAQRGVVIPAIWSAKAKTSIVFLAIISALLELTVLPYLYIHLATLVFSYSALFFALQSAWLYGSIFLSTEKKLANQPSMSSKM